MPEARRWLDVEKVLSAEEAESLLKEVVDELADPTFAAKVSESMADGHELKFEGKALFVLGPSAAGKSHALRYGTVEVPSGALSLDGGYIRSVSRTWAKAIELATSKSLAGFDNFFKDFFKAPMDKVKKQVVEDAIRNRSNVVVPDTASDFKATRVMISQLIEAGYALQFMAVYADKEVCECRGKSRESEEGKKFSSKNWETSVQSILDLQAFLTSNNLGTVTVLDNTGVVHPISLAEVEEKLQLQKELSKKVSGARWCETSLLAGIYKAEGSDAHYEVFPRSFEDDHAAVDVTVIKTGAVIEQLKCVFDVAACTLRPVDSAIGWALRLTGELTADDGFIQPSLNFVRGVPGKSIGVLMDKAATGGIDFLHDALRPLNDEEFQLSAEAARLSGPSEAPSRTEPKALFVVAPSGGGKTTVLKTHAEKFLIKQDEAVFIDSAVFRDFHLPYKAILDNGEANGGIWLRAWPAAKDVLMKAKKRILTMASEAKKDLMVSDTGSDAKKLVEAIEKLKAQGYTVSICGIYAEPEAILARGIAREVNEGKRYNRDLRKLRQTFDAFAPAVRAANGTFCLVKNSQGKPPESYLQGNGGLEIAFDLEEALRWEP